MKERSFKVILAARILAGVIRYFKDDQRKKYALLARHTSHIHAEGIGRFSFKNDQMQILSPTPDDTIVVVEPFPAESGLWNGPDLLPNKLKDGTFEASLNHDLIWAFAREIAAKNGTTEVDVKLWSNQIFELEQRYYAKVKIRAERKLIRRALDWGAKHYSRIKAMLGRLFLALVAALAVGAAAGCAGCWPLFEGGEDGEVEADPIEWAEGD